MGILYQAEWMRSNEGGDQSRMSYGYPTQPGVALQFLARKRSQEQEIVYERR